MAKRHPSHFRNAEGATLAGEQVRFSFGENWRKFLTHINESNINNAEKSFVTFTKITSLRGRTFLDVGCGSGLSSLVAHRLGAERIVSIDIDPNCVECAGLVRERFACGASNWEVFEGSVLDQDFLKTLGHFSYVYSWGVLHHTGAMWAAVEHATQCVDAGGLLHLALYNEHKSSPTWHKIKRICNRYPRTIFPLLKTGYGLLTYAKLILRLQSPLKYTRDYEARRGMSFWRDLEDWLGGLPYEYCKPDQVVDFLSERGLALRRLRTSSRGCNEFLFENLRKHQDSALNGPPRP